jgi:DNA-binding XRE family transcriptional regulator
MLQDKAESLKAKKTVGDVIWCRSITYQAISKWETEQAMPDITLLSTLAPMLNVIVDKLLGLGIYAADSSVPR